MTRPWNDDQRRPSGVRARRPCPVTPHAQAPARAHGTGRGRSDRPGPAGAPSDLSSARLGSRLRTKAARAERGRVGVAAAESVQPCRRPVDLVVRRAEAAEMRVPFRCVLRFEQHLPPARVRGEARRGAPGLGLLSSSSSALSGHRPSFIGIRRRGRVTGPRRRMSRGARDVRCDEAAVQGAQGDFRGAREAGLLDRGGEAFGE